MNALIRPSPLEGSLPAIPSKSDAHRKLICAALADKPTLLAMSGSCQDVDATLRCLSALGAKAEPTPEGIRITPVSEGSGQVALDCGESGSTLRFLLPVAAALRPRCSFTGQGRLPARPLGHLMEEMQSHGVRFSAGQLPLETEGLLQPGCYSLPGDISSQYITGLLLALPLLPDDSEIWLSSALESRAYVDMTLGALRDFGIRVQPTEKGWRIPGGQRYRSPGCLRVEGDWSNAAFFLAAGALVRPITLTGLSPGSPQGDKAVTEILSRFGAKVTEDPEGVRVQPGTLQGLTLDVSGIPDLLPVLAVVASCARGTTVFTGAKRLRLKESDRLRAVAELLRALGGQVQELPEGLEVTGGSLTGGRVAGCGDHRIVMAAAVAACCCREPVTVTGAEAVAKSYPGFFEDYRRLGGNADVL